MLIKNAVFDRHDPLYKISKLFEASDRAGLVLWHPEVDTGEPAPDAVVFFQEHCRLAVTFVPSICAIEGKNWKAMDSSGGVDLKSPIDQAWRAGEAVRKTIKKCIGIGAYVIPVVVFLNMAENDDIKASLGRSQVNWSGRSRTSWNDAPRFPKSTSCSRSSTPTSSRKRRSRWAGRRPRHRQPLPPRQQRGRPTCPTWACWAAPW